MGRSKQQQRQEVPERSWKHLKRVRVDATQRLFEEPASLREVRIKDGDQSGSYKYSKAMDSEGNKSCGSQYIKNANADLLHDMRLTRDWWVQ